MVGAAKAGMGIRQATEAVAGGAVRGRGARAAARGELDDFAEEGFERGEVGDDAPA